MSIIGGIFWLPSAIMKRGKYKKALDINNKLQLDRFSDKAVKISLLPFIPYLIAYSLGMNAIYILRFKKPLMSPNAQSQVQFLLVWLWIDWAVEHKVKINNEDFNQ
jgi:hypothetical protein